ncbi:MAG TPA: FAD-binding oxidoreductase [Thermomicrobiales bacterium]
MDQTALPVTEADAVVVGAGAFGFSCAYHLAKLGAGRVVLLDQYEPGTQVSPRAAGLFKLVQTSEAVTRLARLSIEIVLNFERETGVPMPSVRSGSVLVARTPAHAAMIDTEAEDAAGWGVEIHRIDGREAHRLCPYLEGNRLLGAYYIPGDIYIEEPRSMLLAYHQAAEKLGVRVIGHTPVTGIRVAGGAVEAVMTPRGEIRTPVVVDAAGIWAPWVAEMAGARALVQPVRHELRITAPINGVQATYPIARIIDAAVYLRPARGGIMVGGFEPDPLPLEPPNVQGFTIDMLPLDRRLTARFVELVQRDVPAIAGVPAQEERGGAFTMTADGRLLVGPSPDVRGFWLATGCNGSGFSLSSGVGHCLAEWIVGGEPPFDLSPLSPARFAARPLSADELRAAGVWQYANYYTPR